MSSHHETEPASVADHMDNLMAPVFEIVERALIGLVAVVLVALACIALWNTAVLVKPELEAHNLTKAVTTGVDAVFLTVILLELMNTVVGRGRLVQRVQEFIVVGITSGIRHGLSLVATSGGNETVTRIIRGHAYKVSVPGISNPRETVIDLAVNSGAVLVLVLALWLVRRHDTGSAVPLQHELEPEHDTSE